jgi:hypothetical protein
VGTHGVSGAAPSQEREPELWGHVAAPELPELGVGSQAAGTSGVSGAAPRWEWEPEPRGHVAAS